MSALGSFTDFMFATREMPLSGPEDIPNQMTSLRTFLLRIMLSGFVEQEQIQSGDNLIDYLQLGYSSNYENYLPDEPAALSGDNSLTEVKLGWRFSRVHSKWNDQEIDLNSGDQRTVFKRLKKVKEQKMMTDMAEGMENGLLAPPNSAQMEQNSSSGRQPYSLRCFITEAGGLPIAGTSAGQDGSADSWSTIQTVNLTTYPNFSNQVETYDHTNFDSTILPALDAMWLDVQYMSPTDSQQYVKDTKIQKLRILSNKEGCLAMKRLARDANNNLKPANDLGWTSSGGVTFGGIPFDYIAKLDSVHSTAGKPRFMFTNFNHIRPIFHRGHFMKPIGPKDGGAQLPETHAMFRVNWWNLVCKNRREQGIVRSAA